MRRLVFAAALQLACASRQVVPEGPPLPEKPPPGLAACVEWATAHDDACVAQAKALRPKGWYAGVVGAGSNGAAHLARVERKVEVELRECERRLSLNLLRCRAAEEEAH